MSLISIPSCRVHSSAASSKTVQRRSHIIQDVRNVVSGADTVEQLQSEVRCLSNDQRKEVLKGAKLPIIIPPDHALAMKADLAIPWNKLRIIRR